MANMQVKKAEKQQEGVWWDQTPIEYLKMGQEKYHLELVIEFYTKSDDDLDEIPSKQINSDFSSASEETK